MRHYERTAQIIRTAQQHMQAPSLPETQAIMHFMALKIATLFADYYEKDNPSFDRSRFLKACSIDA